MKRKLDVTKVKRDDIMAFMYYGLVKSTSGNSVRIFDVDNGHEMEVVGNKLVECSFSADQYAEEEKVTKTKAAEILVKSHNRPFTVSFSKSDGSERILRGRLIEPEPLLGRSVVEDLDLTDHRLRQVDHRTINFLIVDNVKYTVK